MGGRTPKQFLLLGGAPILERTIAAFHSLRAVREIVLVVPADCVSRAAAIVRRAGFRKVAHIVPGGKDRQASVFNGLEKCSFRSGIVLVHDAVRPFVRRDTILSVIREELWAVQTPQGFHFALLQEAHMKARADRFHGTDDASLVERKGTRVKIVHGSETNIKITNPDDRKLAEFLLGEGRTLQWRPKAAPPRAR